MIDRGSEPRSQGLNDASKEPHVLEKEDPMDNLSYPGRTGGLGWRATHYGIIREFFHG
jgi:hypothetical protein